MKLAPVEYEACLCGNGYTNIKIALLLAAGFTSMREAVMNIGPVGMGWEPV